MLKIRIPATSESIVDYNARIVVPWQTGMAADFADIRFYEADQVTVLSQYRQGYASGDSAIWWVKIPNKTAYIYDIYMQFGVATELLSDGEATFLFFDSGATVLDLSKWIMTISSTWGDMPRDECLLQFNIPFHDYNYGILSPDKDHGGVSLPHLGVGVDPITIVKRDGFIYLEPVGLESDLVGWTTGAVTAISIFKDINPPYTEYNCEYQSTSELYITAKTAYIGTGDIGLGFTSPNFLGGASAPILKWGDATTYISDDVLYDATPSLDKYTQVGDSPAKKYTDLVVLAQVPPYRPSPSSNTTFFTRLIGNDNPQIDDALLIYDFAEFRRIYHRSYGNRGFLWKAVGTGTTIIKSAFITPVCDYPEGDPSYLGDINNGNMQLSFRLNGYDPVLSFKDVFMFRTGAPSTLCACPTSGTSPTANTDPLLPIIGEEAAPPIVYNNYFIISERCRVLLAGLRDFTIEQGTVFDRTVVWYDENNALVNLTGYSARLSLRKNKNDTSPVFVFTSEAPGAGEGSITLGGAAGTIRLLASAVLTRALDFDRTFYDFEVSPSGAADFTASTDNIRVFEGMFMLSKEATKE